MALIFNSLNSQVVRSSDPIFLYTCDRKMEFVEKGYCKYSFLNYYIMYLPGLKCYMYIMYTIVGTTKTCVHFYSLKCIIIINRSLGAILILILN